jgi:hypothetical protein
MSRRATASCCSGKVCTDCLLPIPKVVDMTHHAFLCERCARSERHSKCNIKSVTAAFTPNETRILSYMIRNYVCPTGPRKEPCATPPPQRASSIRRSIALPSVIKSAQENQIDRSQSAMVTQPGNHTPIEQFAWPARLVAEEVDLPDPQPASPPAGNAPSFKEMLVNTDF